MLLNHEWLLVPQRHRERLQEAAREQLWHEWHKSQPNPVARLADHLADKLIALGQWLKARYQPAT